MPQRTNAISYAERVEIEELFAQYAWGLDAGDVEAVCKTFSPDGIIEDPYGRFEGPGPNGLRLFFDRILQRPDFAGRQHWVSWIDLRRSGAECHARSYALVPAMLESGAVHMHLVAFYNDTLVQHEGQWRFKERVVGSRDEAGVGQDWGSVEANG